MDKDQVITHLLTSNYWWDGTAIKSSDLGTVRNEYLSMIEGPLSMERIICISGIRRSGKTTIAYQFMDHLIKGGTDPKRVMLVKVDLVLKYISDLREVISVYNELTGIDPRTEEAYLFLDEVNTMKDWQVQVKELMDMRTKAKVFVLGSSITLMFKDASESLAGRISFVNVHPLSFREYLSFSGMDIRPDRDIKAFYNGLLPKKESILFHLSNYVRTGGFPEWFKVQNIERWYQTLYDDYLNLILMKDIVQVFNVRDPRMLFNLVREIALLSCERFSYKGLAERLDTDRETLKLYIHYLRMSGLIEVLTLYSKKKTSNERAEKKMVFFDEGMRKAMTLDLEGPRYVETLVADHLVRNGRGVNHLYEPFYWKNDKEVDFIYDDGRLIIPVETKYRNDPRDTKGTIEFMERFGPKVGIIVTKDLFIDEDHGETGRIRYVPLWFFLLCDIRSLIY